MVTAWKSGESRLAIKDYLGADRPELRALKEDIARRDKEAVYPAACDTIAKERFERAFACADTSKLLDTVIRKVPGASSLQYEPEMKVGQWEKACGTTDPTSIARDSALVIHAVARANTGNGNTGVVRNRLAEEQKRETRILGLMYEMASNHAREVNIKIRRVEAEQKQQYEESVRIQKQQQEENERVQKQQQEENERIQKQQQEEIDRIQKQQQEEIVRIQKEHRAEMAEQRKEVARLQTEQWNFQAEQRNFQAEQRNFRAQILGLVGTRGETLVDEQECDIPPIKRKRVDNDTEATANELSCNVDSDCNDTNDVTGSEETHVGSSYPTNCHMCNIVLKDRYAVRYHKKKGCKNMHYPRICRRCGINLKDRQAAYRHKKRDSCDANN
jgi:hypothetical protein